MQDIITHYNADIGTQDTKTEAIEILERKPYRTQISGQPDTAGSGCPKIPENRTPE